MVGGVLMVPDHAGLPRSAGIILVMLQFLLSPTHLHVQPARPCFPFTPNSQSLKAWLPLSVWSLSFSFHTTPNPQNFPKPFSPLLSPNFPKSESKSILGKKGRLEEGCGTT
jgi:hypothetical protein